MESIMSQSIINVMSVDLREELLGPIGASKVDGRRVIKIGGRRHLHKVPRVNVMHTL